jgi:hypothetical protein
VENKIEKYLGFGINSTKAKLQRIVHEMTIEELRATIYDVYFVLRGDESYPNKKISRMDIFEFYNILADRCMELDIMTVVNETEFDKVDAYYKLLGDQ